MAFLILLLICKLIFYQATFTYTNDKFSKEVSDINKHRIQDHKIPERDVSNITIYRLSHDIIPEHYFIKLDLSNVKDYKISSIYGEINIDFRIIHPTKTIDFHAQRPYIKIRNYIFLQRLFNSTNDSVILTNLVEKSYNPSSHIFVFYFSEELSNGNYTLKMEFDCNIDDEMKSFFQITYINTKGEKKWIAATRFRRSGARQIFPCWDEPELTATFCVAIKHCSDHTVLSNMWYKKDPITDNTMWRMFEVTPVISTRLLAIIVFDDISFDPLSDTILSPFHLKFAQNISKEITRNAFYSTWLNLTDVALILDIAIPSFPDNAMVNWGFNFYRLSDIIYEEGKDPVMRKIEVARLIAFKMIQKLLGNLVSPSSSSLWLNDGIPMLLGTQVLDKILPDSQIMDLFTFQYQYESLHLDCGFLKSLTSKSNPSEINSFFPYPHYAKAFTIMNMLRNILSDHTIEYGIQIYYNTYKYKATSIEDFWSAMQIAENKSLNYRYIKYLNVSRIMNAWTTQSQYPVLKVKQYHNSTKNIIISLENFNVSHLNDWCIPVTFTEYLWDSATPINYIWLTFDKSIKKNKFLLFLLENYEDEKIIEILLNLSLIGYFRVNYDVPIWDRIIHHLVPKDLRNPIKQVELTAISKAKLIDDAFHFMIEGQLNSEIFWKMSKFLTAEAEYITWYPMFKAFEYISRILPLPNEKVQRIKKNVQNLFLVITTMDINFKEYPEDDDFTKCLKQEIAKWACVFDYDECINNATDYLMTHINSPFKNILPWWKTWTFCHGISNKFDIWTDILHLWFKSFNSKQSSRFLEFLCCTKNEMAVKLMLRKREEIFTTPNLTNLQVRDHIKIFSLLIAKHAKNNELLDYILYYFEEIKPREISTVAALINIINHVYSTELLVQVELFALNNLKELYMDVSQKIKTRWLQIISLNNDLISLDNSIIF